MTAKHIIEMDKIDLRWGSRPILSQVSLGLKYGEILTIIGPNGAGKTTLVRIALGLLEPDAGKISRAPGIIIGYMPQRLFIDPTFPLTVNRFLGMADRNSRSQAKKILEEVGASHVIHSAVQNLSGGELQRVLLGRALIRNPDLLVLDEPVQGVDVHGQIELYQLITNIREQRGCAVLMVSHDLHLVMAATDRVLCLNQHICCSGTPEAVTSDPAYQDLFGQQAMQHLAIYSHNAKHHQDDFEQAKGD
jgi:zinc transport system ATP-binding protein